MKRNYLGVPWSNPKPTGPPNQQLSITTSSKLTWLGGNPPFSIGNTSSSNGGFCIVTPVYWRDDYPGDSHSVKISKESLYSHGYFPIRIFNGSIFSYKTQTDSAFFGTSGWTKNHWTHLRYKQTEDYKKRRYWYVSLDFFVVFVSTTSIRDRHPWKLTWIIKIMVWKMWIPLKYGHFWYLF